MNTRPSQLLPSADDAIKSLHGFLEVMGYDVGNLDADFGTNSKAAYNQLREQYSFLPDIGDTLDEAEINSILSEIDKNLQTDVAFQTAYINGISSEENVLNLQGALVAGGSWANRHLGDRISEAEMIKMDGQRGVLTERALRNGVYSTGVSTLQANLNLLEGADLEIDGKLGDNTTGAMRIYAEKNGIQWQDDNVQGNFLAVTQYIEVNEQARLAQLSGNILHENRGSQAYNSDVLNAQITSVYLARLKGSDIRTAFDGRTTDNQITAEKSHTLTVMAPAAGITVQASAAEANKDMDSENTIIVTAPRYALSDAYIVTRNEIINDELSGVINKQQANPNSADHVLVYSEKANAYMLVARNGEGSSVYQISDRNVEEIMPGLEDGSIALDASASREIALKIHGNSAETKAYSSQELRETFAANPTSFTRDTQEELMTMSASLQDGSVIRFGLDDFHDALDQLDSKSDWKDSSDPIAMREYVQSLEDYARDVREERAATPPSWPQETLVEGDTVTLNISGQEVSIPAAVWDRFDAQLRESETGYSIGHRKSSFVQETGPVLSRDFASSAEPIAKPDNAPEDVVKLGVDPKDEPVNSPQAIAPAAP